GCAAQERDRVVGRVGRPAEGHDWPVQKAVSMAATVCVVTRYFVAANGCDAGAESAGRTQRGERRTIVQKTVAGTIAAFVRARDSVAASKHGIIKRSRAEGAGRVQRGERGTVVKKAANHWAVETVCEFAHDIVAAHGIGEGVAVAGKIQCGERRAVVEKTVV